LMFAPQELQNRAPSGRYVPQVGQFIDNPLFKKVLTG